VSESEVIALMALVGVVLAALITLLGVLLGSRQKATEIVVADLRAELTDTRAEVKDNMARLAALERRDRAWANYVHTLRRHITDELPPPPPEWPVELDR
jgi:uncharacterized membrane-anchored protein YhcB (DUF1043 family)